MLDFLLHLLQRRKPIGDDRTKEEHAMYAAGWVKKVGSGDGRACDVPVLLLGGLEGGEALAFAAAVVEQDKAPVAALVQDRHL